MIYPYKEPLLDSALPIPASEPLLFDDWQADLSCVQRDGNGTITISNRRPQKEGSESGLVSKKSWEDVSLSFELWLEPRTHFLAKVHLSSQNDQTSNSYHLLVDGTHIYIARHNRVLQRVNLRYGSWQTIRLAFEAGQISLEIGGREVARMSDQSLPKGYCFLGVKSGTARLRNLALGAVVHSPKSIVAEESKATSADLRHVILHDNTNDLQPEVSIVTTVYDRVECLERCIRSVQALHYRKYEHIIVADAPSQETLERIRSLVQQYDAKTGLLRLAVLKSRADDWGITPASVGVQLARGRYLCFLSDDNGYIPDHFEGLLPSLEEEPSLGFVYSSCRYAGRMTLAYSPPTLGRIDLGQPLFRRELFAKYFPEALPYRERVWDWRMIHQLIRSGVRWRHIDRSTFIFRLEQYPSLIV